MRQVLRVGNAQGFWGDCPEAPAAMVAQAPDLDVLTLDYLAEVSMSILAKQRQRDPSLGYAQDFLHVVASLAPVWLAGRRLRLVTNAGGINPLACARAAASVLRGKGCSALRLGVVSGDDVLPLVRAACQQDPHTRAFSHLEDGTPIRSIAGSLTTANAYLGAAPVAEAMRRGADIVITGRVADPSLTVAPAIAHFGWSPDDHNRLAGATVAGHLIECGTQVTGGISSDWLQMPDVAHIGYPIVEISDDGSCVVTKPRGTGGRVDEHTVKEQLIYELGDPGSYLSPDATVSFLTLELKREGHDRVRVSGATGRAPPPDYKVSATYAAGYRASGMLTVCGRDATAKARRCGQIILDRLRDSGSLPEQSLIECLGAGDAWAGGGPPRRVDRSDAYEVVLRLSVADRRREVVEHFTRQVASLITCGPQGTTGYAEGRPRVHELFGYWPTLVSRERVRPAVQLLEVAET